MKLQLVGGLHGFHLAAGTVTQHNVVRLVGPRSVLEVTWSSPASSARESPQHGSRRDVRVSPELQLNSSVKTQRPRDRTCSSPEHVLCLLMWRLVTLGERGRRSPVLLSPAPRGQDLPQRFSFLPLENNFLTSCVLLSSLCREIMKA